MVIAEYGLQGGCSLELLQQIKGARASAEVIFLANQVNVEEAVETIKAGAFDFLVKPIDSEHLQGLITQIIGRQRQDWPDQQRYQTHQIVTQNPGMQQILQMGRQVADSRASILIHGESGTGKELFARFIHEQSCRRQKPFVAVNCGALPETLLESELFGHEKGAFTGALAKKPGKFELADGGTLLLDEITEMQYHLQSKLLRVLQEREVDRVGGRRPVAVDVRVLATTNRDIEIAVSEGEFREDLFYRLNVIPVKLPSLRDRSEDIPLLANHFIKKYNKIDGRSVKNLTSEALNAIKRYPFRGNVRELENMMERAVLLSDGHQIKPEDLMLNTAGGTLDKRAEPKQDAENAEEVFMQGSLKEIEKKMIFHTLEKMNGNRTHAAKTLGISVRTLRNKLNEYKALRAD